MSSPTLLSNYKVTLVQRLSDKNSHSFTDKEASVECFKLVLNNVKQIEIFEKVFTIGDCIELTSNTNVPPSMFDELVCDSLKIKSNNSDDENEENKNDENGGSSDHFVVKSTMIEDGQIMKIQIILKKRTKYEKDVSFTLTIPKKKMNQFELLQFELQQLKQAINNNDGQTKSSALPSIDSKVVSEMKQKMSQMEMHISSLQQQLKKGVDSQSCQSSQRKDIDIATNGDSNDAMLGSIVGQCAKCNTNVYRKDIILFNAVYSNGWQHINCKVTTCIIDAENGGSDKIDHWNTALFNLFNSHVSESKNDDVTVFNQPSSIFCGKGSKIMLFGENIVCNGGMKQWSIKIRQMPATGNICFGITNVNNVNHNCSETICTYEDTFAYESNASNKYGLTYGANDVITMALDMKNYILCFFKNNVHCGSMMNEKNLLENKGFIMFLKMSSHSIDDEFEIEICDCENIMSLKNDNSKTNLYQSRMKLRMKTFETVIGTCGKCGQSMTKYDFSMKNVSLAQNKPNDFCHKNCDNSSKSKLDGKELTIPDLDEWNPLLSSQEFKIEKANNDKVCRATMRSENGNRWRTLFGSIVVPCDTVKIWHVQINHITSNHMAIGIIDESVIDQYRNTQCYSNQYSICLYSNSAVYNRQNHEQCGCNALKVNDVITIMLDTCKNQILFFKNNQLLYFSDKVDELNKTNWVLAASMYYQNDSVEICDCENLMWLKSDNSKTNLCQSRMKSKMKTFETVISTCGKCGNCMTKYDFYVKNVSLVQDKPNEFCHKNCENAKLIGKINSKELTIPDLDEWNPLLSSSAFKIEQVNNGKICRASMRSENGNQWGTLFGSIVVPCDTVKVWHVQIKHITSNYLAIGIIDASVIDQYANTHAYSNLYSISLYNNSGVYNRQKYEQCGSKTLKVNDVITIMLDTCKNQILFFKNNQLLYFSDKVDELNTTNWVLAVSMYYPNDSIEIVETNNLMTDNRATNEIMEPNDDEIIGKCAKCNQNLLRRDYLLENVLLGNNDNMIHKDCQNVYKMSKLSITDCDEWNPFCSNKGFTILDNNGKRIALDNGSAYRNAFGCIKVGNNEKKSWNIRLNRMNSESYVFIGVIENDTSLIGQARNGSNVYSNGKVVCYNASGYVNMRGTQENIGIKLKTMDVLSIHIDTTQNRLMFVKNGKQVLYFTNNANLQNREWILFICAYYANNEFEILSDCDNKTDSNLDDDNVDSNDLKVYGKCRQCNKNILNMDFKYNNTKYVNMQIVHSQCNVNIPKLNVSQMDQFHPLMKGCQTQIENYGKIAKRIGDGSVYQTCVGCIVVSKGKKLWKIKKLKGSSTYVYFGIVDADRCHLHLNTHAYSTGYSFCYGASCVYKNGSSESKEAFKEEDSAAKVTRLSVTETHKVEFL